MDNAVASLVGAWIEIREFGKKEKNNTVASLVGAWIEINILHFGTEFTVSLPLWERGLK